MASILILVPDLGINGAAKQVSLLAPEFKRQGNELQVVALRRGGLFSTPLREAGIHVQALNQRGPFDPRPLLELRRIVRAHPPSVIHAWRRPALRTLAALASCTRLPHIIAADVAGPRWPWYDRLALTCVDQVVAGGEADTKAIPSTRVRRVPFCVTPTISPNRAGVLADLGLPANARLIVCSGAIEPGHGFKRALWIFDILAYVDPTLWLLIVGDGSRQGSLQNLVRQSGRDSPRVCWAGGRMNAASLLHLADVVWVLGERGGRNTMLEALTADRPVVARARDDLREILGESDAGTLVERAEPHEVARATRRYLDAGACGRNEPWDSARFDLAEVARLWLALTGG